MSWSQSLENRSDSQAMKAVVINSVGQCETEIKYVTLKLKKTQSLCNECFIRQCPQLDIMKQKLSICNTESENDTKYKL